MTVLVTGASRGIGRAVALRLHGAGTPVVGVFHRAEEAARSLRAAGPEIRVVQADLASLVGIEAVVAACPGGGLTGLVLSAGISIRARFDELEANGVDPIAEQLRVDLQAPLELVRALLRARALAPGASIVFVSSNLARHGLAGKVAYSAAKAGIEGAVRALAHELGPTGRRVNAVAPGLLCTDMTADLGDADYEAYAQEVPLGRVGEPDDVASVVTFLLGDDARYVTGQILDVDGGWGA
jgi:NAD(P)-dependent dehydrogenase (short-subunit alcohol dehydrogenase family)